MQIEDTQLREMVNEIIADAELTLPDEEIINTALPVIRREIASALAQSVTVNVTDSKGKTKKRVNLGLQHKAFPRLLEIANVRTADGGRLNVWLAGPAGTGKTTAARNVAKALGLPFFFNGAIDTEHKLLGFTDAQGRIVSRPFRKAFQQGGVYLFDEVDGSLPGALLAFNAALANGHCDFPDGCFERHPDCIIIAAANTYGIGGSVEYVGRLKQDAAFLDRFIFMDWPIDETMETQIAATLGQVEWAKEVQAYRGNAARHGIRVVISPRSTYAGAAMLNAGIPKADVIEMAVRKGINPDAWAKIVAQN